mgnify:CR=1 FL=1
MTCFIQRIKQDIEIGIAVGQESGFTRMFSDTLAYIQARVDRRHAVSHVFAYLIATEVGEIGFSSTGGTCSAALVVHIADPTRNTAHSTSVVSQGAPSERQRRRY